MLGGLETLIGVLILLLLILFLSPKAIVKLFKLKSYGEALNKLQKKQVEEILKKVEKGEITIDEAYKMIEKEIGE